MYLLTYQGICISLALPAFFPSSFQLRELGFDLYPPLSVPPKQTSVIGSRCRSGNLGEICERHQCLNSLNGFTRLDKAATTLTGKYAECVTAKLPTNESKISSDLSQLSVYLSVCPFPVTYKISGNV